jgi:predicted HicB family RNase H-like nuclease
MSKPAPKEKRVTVTVRLPERIKKLLEENAAKTKRTLGGYVELALEAQFQKDQKK